MQVDWPDCKYPLSIRLKMLLSVIFNLLAFTWVVLQSVRFWRWAFSFFGPLEPLALVLAATYLAASFWVYSQPVNALDLHGKRQRTPQLAAPSSAGTSAGANGSAAGELKKGQ